MSDVQWTAFILRPACVYICMCWANTISICIVFSAYTLFAFLPTPCRCDVKGLTQKGEPPLHLYSIYVWCNLEACLCFESNLYIRMLDFGLLWPAWHVKELNVPWCSINCQSCIHVKELKKNTNGLTGAFFCSIYIGLAGARPFLWSRVLQLNEVRCKYLFICMWCKPKDLKITVKQVSPEYPYKKRFWQNWFEIIQFRAHACLEWDGASAEWIVFEGPLLSRVSFQVMKSIPFSWL